MLRPGPRRTAIVASALAVLASGCGWDAEVAVAPGPDGGPAGPVAAEHLHAVSGRASGGWRTTRARLDLAGVGPLLALEATTSEVRVQLELDAAADLVGRARDDVDAALTRVAATARDVVDGDGDGVAGRAQDRLRGGADVSLATLGERLEQAVGDGRLVISGEPDALLDLATDLGAPGLACGLLLTVDAHRDVGCVDVADVVAGDDGTVRLTADDIEVVRTPSAGRGIDGPDADAAELTVAELRLVVTGAVVP